MRPQAAFLAQDSIASRYISGVSVELSLIKLTKIAGLKPGTTTSWCQWR